MMTSLLAHRLQRPSRFAWLMGMYSENYWTLTRLFGVQQLAPGRYRSEGEVGMPLVIDVLERAPFTLEMKLSYQLIDAASGNPDPSAHVRFYCDARVAEVTACHEGSRIEHVLGRDARSADVMRHRLRMNAFLGKWLAYLEQSGHSRFGLQPCA
jgi:uncharacterized protein YqiB (DUF1249 family)